MAIVKLFTAVRPPNCMLKCSNRKKPVMDGLAFPSFFSSCVFV
jgi:hypothetical protein